MCWKLTPQCNGVGWWPFYKVLGSQVSALKSGLVSAPQEWGWYLRMDFYKGQFGPLLSLWGRSPPSTFMHGLITQEEPHQNRDFNIGHSILMMHKTYVLFICLQIIYSIATLSVGLLAPS
jgi:hypothetical protein